MACLLLVEDEGIHRRIFGSVLARAGHDVRSASDLPEAATMARAEAPDLAIIDYLLAGSENGAQVAALLRSMYPQIPIIITSGMPHEAIARELEVVKPHEFLAKPFDLEMLHNMVEECLAGVLVEG